MDWGNGGWSAGDWVAMSTMMILFWAVLIAVVAWVVCTVRGARGSIGPADQADVLLAEGFARGEIDGEEFTRAASCCTAAVSASCATGPENDVELLTMAVDLGVPADDDLHDARHGRHAGRSRHGS